MFWNCYIGCPRNTKKRSYTISMCRLHETEHSIHYKIVDCGAHIYRVHSTICTNRAHLVLEIAGLDPAIYSFNLKVLNYNIHLWGRLWRAGLPDWSGWAMRMLNGEWRIASPYRAAHPLLTANERMQMKLPGEYKWISIAIF